MNQSRFLLYKNKQRLAIGGTPGFAEEDKVPLHTNYGFTKSVPLLQLLESLNALRLYSLAVINYSSGAAMALGMLSVLVRAPELNPVTKKARSVPTLNPGDKYGRVFFFSWLGFLIAFLSWYAFPPLVRLSVCVSGKQVAMLTFQS